MPPLPRIGQGVKGGVGALPGMGDNPLFTPNLGGVHVRPQPNTQPILPLEASAVDLPPEAPGLSQGPLTRIAQAQQAVRTTAAENRAIHALAHPATIPHLDDAAKQVINNPTPRIQAALHVMGIGKMPHLLTQDEAKQAVNSLDFKTGKMKLDTGQNVTQKDLAISGFQPHTSKVQQIISGEANNLLSLGPGLAKFLGEDVPISAYNTFFHWKAMQQNPAMDPAQRDVNQMIKGFVGPFAHPERAWRDDPASFINSWATLPFAGAGAAARVGALSKVGDLAAANDISIPRQIGRTLIKPPRQTRGISAQFGEGATPLTIRPPAYKSALGGYAQRAMDWYLQRKMNEPPSDLTPQLYRDLVSGWSMSAPSRFGRKLRYDFETNIRGRAGALKSRMDEKLASALARGTTFRDVHNDIYNAGASHAQIADRPDRQWVGIKPRKSDEPTLAPEFLTPQHIKDYKGLTINSDNALANEFKAGGRMVATDKEVEADAASANPQLRFVPKDLIDSLKPYEHGAGGKALNLIDRGTQIVRSGRFMTPAYGQWAVQNGLIHAAEAGIKAPRNIYQLHREWPKLGPEVQGAIDGWMGKGIARSTEGGEAAAESWLGKKTEGLRERWHVLNDQWARRMQAIHELNEEGYHTVASWKKLYKTNPDRMRQIVGHQGADAAINYSEMTPAERASAQKVMTAYGWTRGATTYAGRYPLNHPIKAAIGMQIAQDIGQPYVKHWYDMLGGMVPGYLKEDLPFGGKYLLPTSFISPTGTAGKLAFEVPGLTGSSTESLSSEESPVMSGITGFAEGRDPYGKQYVGNQRVTEPLKGIAHAFKPYSALETLIAGKKGGTYVQGPLQAAEQFAGVPLRELKNPKQTAGLGEKDYEQSLSPTDRIRFQYSRKMELLACELALYQKANNGNPIDGQSLSRLKADFDNVEQRDIFMYQYANAHGAKTWKSLPPLNKFAGTVDWMTHHGYSHSQLAALQHEVSTQATDDKQVEQLVNTLWQQTGIGHVERAWKSVVKGLQPPALTHANG